METTNVLVQEKEENTPVYRTYKDRVFRMLFKEKKRLLELYNALNDTAYGNEEELTVNTLENVIYLKMKNDVFADLYKKYVGDADLSTSRRIMLPTPRYVIFYNGSERREEEFTQYLSESFEDDGGCIELTVKTLNINYGHNKELLEKCPTLNEYAQFVSMIRTNLKQMSLSEAMEKTIEACISQDILKDFLMEQKSEVVAMSIYEYNEEYVMRVTYEEGEIAGYKRGYKKNLVHDIEAAMKNLDISLEKACEVLEISMEEYQQAKAENSQTD